MKTLSPSIKKLIPTFEFHQQFMVFALLSLKIFVFPRRENGEGGSTKVIMKLPYEIHQHTVRSVYQVNTVKYITESLSLH